MSAALQIESKVNALAHGSGECLAAEAGGDPDDAVDADQKHGNNQDDLVLEILVHRPVSLIQKMEFSAKK